MTCRALGVSHICSEMQCFFLFLNRLTLNPISPCILKQRLFLFPKLGSSQGLYVYPSTWNSSQFYSLLVSKRKEGRCKGRKQEIRFAWGWKTWLACPSTRRDQECLQWQPAPLQGGEFPLYPLLPSRTCRFPAVGLSCTKWRAVGLKEMYESLT